MTLVVIAALALLASSDPVNPAGLVPLPCEGGALQPAASRYCRDEKNFVTPDARQALTGAASRVARDHPGAVIRYMEASWPSGVRPMPPHFSHGDGRQVDLALFYRDRSGRPLARSPKAAFSIAEGYGAFEPPRREADRVCVGIAGHHDRPDPPASRSWRLDDDRTASLIRALSADPRVRRIFIEPHLKSRLGFAADPKVRFAGCNAARHDDHIHVDFR